MALMHDPSPTPLPVFATLGEGAVGFARLRVRLGFGRGALLMRGVKNLVRRGAVLLADGIDVSEVGIAGAGGSSGKKSDRCSSGEFYGS